jgi:hypothetical protein
MVHVDPSHDVWCAALDAIGDHTLLKTSNLVCRAWHVYLQPRLMASIRVEFVDFEKPNSDAPIMKRIQHLVRHLCLEASDVETQDWRAGISLAPTSFSNLVKLELCHITFVNITDLWACLSMTPKTLESLAIFDCRCPDIRKIYRSAGNNRSITLPVHSPHSLALRDNVVHPVGTCKARKAGVQGSQPRTPGEAPQKALEHVRANSSLTITPAHIIRKVLLVTHSIKWV